MSERFNCDFNFTFADCTGLEKAPKIPSTTTSVAQMFEGCSSLAGTIELPKALEGFEYEGDCGYSNIIYK